jgi:hypothetical protein
MPTLLDHRNDHLKFGRDFSPGLATHIWQPGPTLFASLCLSIDMALLQGGNHFPQFDLPRGEIQQLASRLFDDVV